MRGSLSRTWEALTLVGILAVSLAAVASAAVRAADAAEWTFRAGDFESYYPAGFGFGAEIESSAGPVERARVVWSHAPGTQRSRPAERDPISGQWRVRWEPTGSDAIPPWLAVVYHWEASDIAGNTFRSADFQAEYADFSRGWQRFESADVIVFALDLPDDVGEQTLAAMAAQRETFRAAWGGGLPYTPRVILFGSRAAWREWQIGAVDGAVIGTTQPDWGATVQVVSGSSRDLAFGTVLHEVAHLYQAEYVGALPVNWFVEGNATLFELSRQYDYEAAVRRMAAQGSLPALLEGTGPGLSSRRGYDLGYTFFVWLVQSYGWEGHRQLMSLLREGIGRNAALEQVTGLTTTEIESRWRMWLGASGQVPTLAPTPTFRFFPSPTPYIPGTGSSGS